jgi:hypothetical protein
VLARAPPPPPPGQLSLLQDANDTILTARVGAMLESRRWEATNSPTSLQQETHSTASNHKLDVSGRTISSRFRMLIFCDCRNILPPVVVLVPMLPSRLHFCTGASSIIYRCTCSSEDKEDFWPFDSSQSQCSTATVRTHYFEERLLQWHLSVCFQTTQRIKQRNMILPAVLVYVT